MMVRRSSGSWRILPWLLATGCVVTGNDRATSADASGAQDEASSGATPDDDVDAEGGSKGEGSTPDDDEDTSSTPGDTGAPDCAGETPPTGASTMRRLTRVEYALSIQELLQLPEPPDVALVPEDPNEEGFRTFAEHNGLSAQHLRAYLTIAEQLAADLMADPTRRAAVLGCDPSAPTCLESFVRSFGRLAFRRPITAEEATPLVEVARSVAADENDAFRIVIEALLASPSFIFRVEGSGAPEELVTLNGYEIASRLSFAIWGRGPSAELLDAAERGELETPDDIVRQADAMLDDPRSRTFYENFFEQWLGFETLRAPNELPTGWYQGILDDFKRETHDLLGELAWSEERPFADVFTANHARPSRRLAEFYGVSLDPLTGEAVFPSDDPRSGSGILTHPAILGAKTDGDLVAKRGAWYRRTFLCQTIEVPPGLFETLGDRLVGLTYLEILAERNEDAACAGCHALIDPIGVGLAHWNSAGLYDAEIDTSAFGITPSVPGFEDPEFGSAAELGQRTSASPDVQACLTERMFLFAHGREAEARSGEHTCSVDGALARFATTGRFRDLVLGIVADDQFRYRKNPT